ncbi:MAG: Lysine--tRNA ligase [Candidatus Methanogaster sp.]|nr:MAG: Lysine--tRNA ligase [ANME-2 cluster archaeon]
MDESRHWADVIADNVATKKHVIATGITPSGEIHIGNMREVVTADAAYRALCDAGIGAELIYIADTLDPLRKVYPFLSDDYSEHVGKPLSAVPCPCGDCANYAEHYLTPFLESLERLDISPTIYRAHELYGRGDFVPVTITALTNRDRVATILKEVSHRELPARWSPFNVICEECGRITTTTVTGSDENAGTVDYACECGQSGTVPVKGNGKLTWRVDWASRWRVLGVTIEPFGKDHATRGGSYDTGTRISREIYDYDPPYPIIYEWIHLKGKGAMSSSTGVTVTIADMLRVMPPEVLRYLIIRTKPEKHIDFDPSRIIDLIDEFDRATGRAWELSMTKRYLKSGIPFTHLVTAVQIASDLSGIHEVLDRSGYSGYDEESVRQRVLNVKNWLMSYAPDSAIFEVQETLPDAAKNLSDEQRAGLGALASHIQGGVAAKDLHDLVYAVSEESGTSANKMFQAIYISLLGKKSGPRAGYFMASLDKEFLVSRLRAAGSGGEIAGVDA